MMAMSAMFLATVLTSLCGNAVALDISEEAVREYRKQPQEETEVTDASGEVWRSQAEAWIERLQSAKSLKLQEREIGSCIRMSAPYAAQCLIVGGAAIVFDAAFVVDSVQSSEVSAASTMTPDSFSLRVWRTEGNANAHRQDLPVLELDFQDGWIDELVRVEDQELAFHYKATRPDGIGETAFPPPLGEPDGVCHVGMLYQSWLGSGGYQIEVYQQHFGEVEFVGMKNVGGDRCFELRGTHFSLDRTYFRGDTFYLSTDPSNPHIVRWDTCKFASDPKSRRFAVIGQDRIYEGLHFEAEPIPLSSKGGDH